MQCLRLLLLFVLAILYQQTGSAQPNLGVTQITMVSEPVDLTGAGDNSNRLFIVDKDGKISIYNLLTSTLLPVLFLDISTRVLNEGEQGLLGLTFHPNYETNGYFYVNYIHLGTSNTRISRFQVSSDPNVADAASELILMDIPQPPGQNNHKGGDLNFGPDGFLYIALGDGGGGGDPDDRAQDPQDLLGKMLRIDVNTPSGIKNYSIPPNNPFVGVQTPDVLDEIWALGLRNPWRFSFDRTMGDLWIADVGQNAWEEVDFQAAGSAGGQNYGWNCHEANHLYVPAGCTVSHTAAIFEYGHNPTNGGNSITGGFVYRGTVIPSLQGWYVVADFTSDNFWLLKSDGTFILQPNVPITNVVSFGEDDNGELYVSSYGGEVYRITNAALPIDLLRFSGNYRQDRVQLSWTTATERNAAYFQIERKTESGDFSALGRVEAVGESLVQQRYSFDDLSARAGDNVYRLRMVDRDGSIRYSPAITVVVRATSSWQLSPNPATGKVTLSIQSEEEPPMLRFEAYNAQGRLVLEYEEVAPVFPFHHDFRLTHLPPGVYSCRLEVDGKTEVRRLVIQ